MGPAGPFSHRCSALGPGALCTVLRDNKASVFYIILYKFHVHVIHSISILIDFKLKCIKFVDLYQIISNLIKLCQHIWNLIELYQIILNLHLRNYSFIVLWARPVRGTSRRRPRGIGDLAHPVYKMLLPSMILFVWRRSFLELW